MPDFDDRIDSFSPGDDVDVRRIVTDLPTGQTVTNAWLTIKEKLEQMDTEAIISKAITTANQSGIGHIEDDGAGDLSATLRFDLREIDTKLLKPLRAYHHEVKIRTNANKVSRPFVGLTIAEDRVTRKE